MRINCHVSEKSYNVKDFSPFFHRSFTKVHTLRLDATQLMKRFTTDKHISQYLSNIIIFLITLNIGCIFYKKTYQKFSVPKFAIVKVHQASARHDAHTHTAHIVL